MILIEPELHMDEEVLVPDLAGLRRDRLPTLPDEVGIAVAPDWVCEVLSPSTRTYDLTEKRDIYREQGVGHLWFVDPAARTLEAFALTDGAWVLIAALHDDAEVAVVKRPGFTGGPNSRRIGPHGQEEANDESVPG
jgi:Uma2 family endonuclease